ncbi:putative Axonemal dynein light chain [Trypanosoma vivax]|nr:putative Axonemal dynein light chain [Trypanosoma vivax]
MQQTTDTYDILFDSASQYAVRKAIERDMRSFLFSEKEQMESEVRRLENRVNELRAKHNGMVKRFEEQKQTEQKMHEEEMRYLKRVNQQLINEIKRVTALEKASTTT